MSENITIILSRDEALVLFELFARSDDDDAFVLRHNAEYIALMSISCQLEKVLAEPFGSRYDDLLTIARDRVAKDYEGTAPGVQNDVTS